MSLPILSVDYSAVYNALSISKGAQALQVQRDTNNASAVQGITQSIVDLGKTIYDVYNQDQLEKAKAFVADDTNKRNQALAQASANGELEAKSVENTPDSRMPEGAKASQAASAGQVTVDMPDSYKQLQQDQMDRIDKEFGSATVKAWLKEQILSNDTASQAAAYKAVEANTIASRNAWFNQNMTDSMQQAITSGSFAPVDAVLSGAPWVSPQQKQALRAASYDKWDYGVKDLAVRGVVAAKGVDAALAQISQYQGAGTSADQVDALTQTALNQQKIETAKYEQGAKSSLQEAATANADLGEAQRLYLAKVPQAYQLSAQAAFIQAQTQIQEQTTPTLIPDFLKGTLDRAKVETLHAQGYLSTQIYETMETSWAKQDADAQAVKEDWNQNLVYRDLATKWLAGSLTQTDVDSAITNAASMQVKWGTEDTDKWEERLRVLQDKQKEPQDDPAAVRGIAQAYMALKSGQMKRDQFNNVLLAFNVNKKISGNTSKSWFDAGQSDDWGLKVATDFIDSKSKELKWKPEQTADAMQKLLSSWNYDQAALGDDALTRAKAAVQTVTNAALAKSVSSVPTNPRNLNWTDAYALNAQLGNETDDSGQGYKTLVAGAKMGGTEEALAQRVATLQAAQQASIAKRLFAATDQASINQVKIFPNKDTGRATFVVRGHGDTADSYRVVNAKDGSWHLQKMSGDGWHDISKPKLDYIEPSSLGQ